MSLITTERIRAVAPAPEVAPVEVVAPTPGRLADKWAKRFVLAWPAAVFAIMALEPPASEPTGAAAVLANTVFLVFFATLAVTVAAAARRRSSAVTWSTVTAGMLLFLTISCPVSGHHQHVGAWWYAQLGICALMGLMSLTARQGAAVSPRQR